MGLERRCGFTRTGFGPGFLPLRTVFVTVLQVLTICITSYLGAVAPHHLVCRWASFTLSVIRDKGCKPHEGCTLWMNMLPDLVVDNE